MPSCTRHPVGRYWKQFFIILAPLILLLLFIIPEETLPKKANQCLYVMLLMALYWCTEVVNLAVTSCIPIFLFPLMGIISTKEVCKLFLTDTVMMFVGGLMVALAVEKCDLHKRIALGILNIVGTKPLWLMLGFMLPTWFLSMWMSNTATTAMMLPICDAVINSLTKSHQRKEDPDQLTESNNVPLGEVNSGFSEHNDDINTQAVIIKGDTSFHPDMVNTKKHDWKDTEAAGDAESRVDRTTGNVNVDNFAKGITLSICYSANIGGTATLTGTPVNYIMKGFADELWEERLSTESPVTFAAWVAYGFPVSFLSVTFAWLWLTVLFNGFRALCPCKTAKTKADEEIALVIKKEYEKLGKIRFAEVVVLVMFVIMIALWFFRAPGFMTGWADLAIFKRGYLHDAVVSILIAFILCLIPSTFPRRKNNDCGPVETLLDWETIHEKIPWGVVFLVGGGFALAKGSTESGLSAWIAARFSAMAEWPGWAMVLVFSLIVSFMTEVTSNSATSSILLPIAWNLADAVGRNPLYLMFPTIIAASFAFMLPVATPPNAIAFSYGRIQIIDMVKAGIVLNLVSVAFLVIGHHTWAEAFFELEKVPWNMTQFSTAAP